VSLGRLSRAFESRSEILPWQETLTLVGLGALAVVLNATLDAPLRLPGHTGLWWMALLVIGRSTSKQRWAASVSSLGAACLSVVPLWGFGDPFVWLIYLLPGPILDLTYGLGRPLQRHAWFLVLLAGLAHASKPLVRVLISTVSGWPYGSLMFGLVYPLGYHIGFGLLGGLLGAGAVWAIRRKQ
jgi:hypothetical protein